MTPFVFDTLSASKQLREAGMAEGVAEAVVSVFQHAFAMPDISHLATKEQVEALQADLGNVRREMATKADLEVLQADLGNLGSEMATRSELVLFRAEVKAEFALVRAELSEKLRTQGWATLGGMAVLLTLSTAAGRLLG